MLITDDYNNYNLLAYYFIEYDKYYDIEIYLNYKIKDKDYKIVFPISKNSIKLIDIIKLNNYLSVNFKNIIKLQKIKKTKIYEY